MFKLTNNIGSAWPFWNYDNVLSLQSHSLAKSHPVSRSYSDTSCL